MAVRWRPPPKPTIIAGRESEDSLMSDVAEAGGVEISGDGPEQAGQGETDPLLAGTPPMEEPGLDPAPGDSVVRPGTPASELAGEQPGAEVAGGAAEIPPGFYAIVGSSLNYSGIAGLTRNLSEAGFPTRIQRHRDEANEMWYRALVGPYANREAAEAAALTLRQERGLQGWIAEIGPDVRPRSSTENR